MTGGPRVQTSFDNLNKETDMIDSTRKLLVITALSLGLTFVAGSAFANPPPPQVLCHNIGGPQELGANCDNANADAFPCVLITNPLVYAGIVIDPNDSAFEAHLKHGDGFAITIFDPPLHLASQGAKHEASNVECLAVRELTQQPPEPGN